MSIIIIYQAHLSGMKKCMNACEKKTAESERKRKEAPKKKKRKGKGEYNIQRAAGITLNM